MLIHDGWRPRNERTSWIRNHPSLSCIRSYWGDGLEQFWPQRIFSGGTSEAQRLPEWEQNWGPEVWGESVSLMPLGEEVEDRKIQSPEPGCFSESLGILPLPARDLWTRFHQLPSENKLGTVHSARLSVHCWNMAALHQQVAYFSTLEFILCRCPTSTFQQRGTVRVQQLHNGLNGCAAMTWQISTRDRYY